MCCTKANIAYKYTTFIQKTYLIKQQVRISFFYLLISSLISAANKITKTIDDTKRTDDQEDHTKDHRKHVTRIVIDDNKVDTSTKHGNHLNDSNDKRKDIILIVQIDDTTQDRKGQNHHDDTKDDTREATHNLTRDEVGCTKSDQDRTHIDTEHVSLDVPLGQEEIVEENYQFCNGDHQEDATDK